APGIDRGTAGRPCPRPDRRLHERRPRAPGRADGVPPDRRDRLPGVGRGCRRPGPAGVRGRSPGYAPVGVACGDVADLRTPPRPRRVGRRGPGMRSAARVAGLGTSIFTEMTALALRTGAINLGQGFPDTGGPPAVIEAAVTALRSGENQYAPLPGVPALREAVLEHQRAWYGLEPEDVLITFGATEAIAAALF